MTEKISKTVSIDMLEKLEDGTYKLKYPNTLAELVKETEDKNFVTQAQIDGWNSKTSNEHFEKIIEGKIDTEEKGTAGGVASLDSNVKVPLSQIPDTARQQTYVLTTETEKDELKDLIPGEKAFITENGNSYIWDGVEWQTSAKPEWENVNLQWTNLKGIPEEFNPKDHTHLISEVDGLEGELGKKADKTYVDGEITDISLTPGPPGEHGPAGSVYQETEPEDKNVLWVDPSEEAPVFNAVDRDEVPNIKVNKAKDADTVSGYTLKKSVPADANFNDTLYTAGTNIGIDEFNKISVIGQLGLTEEEVKKVKVEKATDADTVGGYTVEKDVPSDAIFTDTKIEQSKIPPIDAVEGDLWLDTSDDDYQGSVLEDFDKHLLKDNEIKHKAKQISLSDSNFASTNVEGGMSELFTNVSNGKDLVSGAITDVDDSVVIPTEPSFNDLAGAIGGISTGKKWASGEDRINPLADNEMIFQGLPFTPSRVIITMKTEDEQALTVISSEPDIFIHSNIVVSSIMFKYMGSSTSDVGSILTNGFKLSGIRAYNYHDVIWWAYE